MTLKPSKITTGLGTCLLSLMVSTLPASATDGEAEVVKTAGIVEDDGGSERINFSGKLRMLSQRIPAAACNLTAGVDPFNSAKLLTGATAEFSQIVDALENGNSSMGVHGEETNRKSKAAIGEVKTVWGPVKAAAANLLREADNSDAGTYIADQNMALLGKAKMLVTQLSGQYSDPAALLQADAIRIDIAGRQRMLTQKVSKEACHILSGIDADASKAAVSKTIQMFEVSLQALRFGMPEAGIKASEAQNIVDGLSKVAASWGELRPHLTTIEAGDDLDLDARAELFNGLNTTMANMNKVVGMYSDASKLGL